MKPVPQAYHLSVLTSFYNVMTLWGRYASGGQSTVIGFYRSN